jgi:hypothetical protein
MSIPDPWYRVFARAAGPVPPAVVLADLQLDGAPVAGHFRGDEEGWYRCELHTTPDIGPLIVECYRGTEAGVRPELQSWAAYLDALDSPAAQELMATVSCAAQVFTARQHDPRAAEVLQQLCRNLAGATDGVYQIDGEGFFWSNGVLALGEIV